MAFVLGEAVRTDGLLTIWTVELHSLKRMIYALVLLLDGLCSLFEFLT